MTASYKKYILNFKQPSGTSRGVLSTKETWFILLEENGKQGIGECGILRTLSVDDRPDYEGKLKWVCENIHLGLEVLLETCIEFPSIQFGLEQAFISLRTEDRFLLFPSAFTEGSDAIAINGLIWMGNETFMKQQIETKLQQGFNCIKMKIGAIDFDTELKLLASVRQDFSSKEIELRVDANGAFAPGQALEKLKRLSEFELHSIEQPVKAGQWDIMAELCRKTPLPIALDEELIGVFHIEDKEHLLRTIAPQYVILKPSLVGGIKGSSEWIKLAEHQKTGWWITSALESNIGLNAIAQWTYTLQSKMPQGLGTGGLFTNNFDSPLYVDKGQLHYKPGVKWDFQ